MVLTVGGLLEVDVRVPERAAGHHVPAHPDGEDGSGGTELLVQHGLGHVLVQIPHIQRSHRVTGRAGVHLHAEKRRRARDADLIEHTRTDEIKTARFSPRRRSRAQITDLKTN